MTPKVQNYTTKKVSNPNFNGTKMSILEINGRQLPFTETHPDNHWSLHCTGYFKMSLKARGPGSKQEIELVNLVTRSLTGTFTPVMRLESCIMVNSDVFRYIFMKYI
jgi:hypothetical protein